jgi:hypothetical protein
MLLVCACDICYGVELYPSLFEILLNNRAVECKMIACEYMNEARELGS